MRFEIGDRVTVKYPPYGPGIWAGVVKTIKDGRNPYDVKFEDGDRFDCAEDWVELESVRPASDEGSHEWWQDSQLCGTVHDYYERNHIAPATYKRFHCPDKEECRKDSNGRRISVSKFSCGNEPLIGSKYERHERHRLLIVSQEAAGGDTEVPYGRTIGGHAHWEFEEIGRMRLPYCKHRPDEDDEESCTRCKGRNRGIHPKSHWFKTNQTAIWIFQVGDTGHASQWVWDSSRRKEYPAVAAYWAHTNSGKCSHNRPGGGSAPSQLFKNCRKYLGREIRMLAPDIIVSQGNHARDAIQAAVNWNEVETERDRPPFEIGRCYVLLIPHPALWIVMPHPNSRHGIWYGTIERKTPYWARRVRDFFRRTDRT